MLLARLRSGRMTETVGEVAGAVATDAAIGADGVEAIEELLQRLVRSVTVGHIVGMLGQVAAVVVVVICVVVISVGNRLRLMRIIGVFLLDAAARARARARDRSRSRSRTAAREHVIGIVVFGHCRGFTSSFTSSLFPLITSPITSPITMPTRCRRTDAHNKRDTFVRPKRYAQLISPGYCTEQKTPCVSEDAVLPVLETTLSLAPILLLRSEWLLGRAAYLFITRPAIRHCPHWRNERASERAKKDVSARPGEHRPRPAPARDPLRKAYHIHLHYLLATLRLEVK